MRASDESWSPPNCCCAAVATVQPPSSDEETVWPSEAKDQAKETGWAAGNETTSCHRVGVAKVT